MTNEQIIFNERVRLMREGVIGKTGRVFEIDNGDGTKTMVDEPEQLHTFQAWKEMGYIVKKGEHAVAKITIWKASQKKIENSDDEELKMFMKTAAFFKRSQVEQVG